MSSSKTDFKSKATSPSSRPKRRLGNIGKFQLGGLNRPILITIISSFLLLIVVAIGITELLYRWKVKSQLEASQEIQESHLKAYLEDQLYLSGQPGDFLRTSMTLENQNGSDASAILNPKLFWSPRSVATDNTAKSPLVRKEDREELLRLEANWIEKNSRVRLMKVNLSIFESLDKFTHWDLEQNSPVARLTADKNFVPPSQLPVPDINDLLILGKVRLMTGAMEKKPLQALEDVRNLARLMLTTESMQLVLAGLALLDDERHAFRYFAEKNLPEVQAWKPIDSNVTRRARRALKATRGYLRVSTDVETFKRIFSANFVPIGICAAMNEAIPFEFALRDLLEPHVPFEYDYRQEYALLDDAFKRAQKNCRFRYLEQVLHNGHVHTDVPGPFFVKRLPFIRKIFGLRFSVANFGGFQAYDQ